MRKLLWVTIGFCLSCFLCVYKLWDANLLLWIVVPGIAALAAGCIRQRSVKFAVLALVLLGFSVGNGWFCLYRNTQLVPLREYDGQTLPLSIRASDFSEPSRYSDMVEGTVSLAGRNYRVLVYLNDMPNKLHPGDVLEGSFRLRVTAPGGLKESHYHQGKRIFLIASLKGQGTILPSEHPFFRDYPAIVRHRMKETIHTVFPEDTAPFALALMLGDTAELDYETTTSLSIAGIRHLAAVSGLHIGFAYAFIVLLLGRNRFVTPIIGTCFLFLFAAVAGFTPSVTRACLMTSLMALEPLFFREYDSLTALSFATLVMLIGNPFLVTSAGMQLSVASVLGIVCFSRPISEYLGQRIPKGKTFSIPAKLRSFTANSVSITIGALITTIPLTGFYFHTISVISVLTNLLTIWCVSFLFCGIGIVIFTGLFSVPLAALLAKLVSLGIQYVLWIAKVLSALPFAAVYTASSWIVIWMILSYGLVLKTWLSGKRRKRAICAVASGLIAAMVLSWLVPRLDTTRLSVLYVGEGQCLILQSKGHTMLVDCGGNYDQTAADAAAEELLSQGIHTLDAVALTHYDRDHTGGLPYLLTRIDADTFYVPDIQDNGFLENLNTRSVLRISETTQIPLGDGLVTLFAPGNLKTANENCMCVLFETPNCGILITGDRGVSGEKHLVKEEILPDVDILIAGHHGSKNATTDLLLDTVTPETVIVSAGKNNSYGHPAQEMLERLDAHGCTVLRTDLQGTIRIRR